MSRRWKGKLLVSRIDLFRFRAWHAQGKLPKLGQKDALLMVDTEMPNFWATETWQNSKNKEEIDKASSAAVLNKL